MICSKFKVRKNEVENRNELFLKESKCFFKKLYICTGTLYTLPEAVELAAHP